MTTTQSKPIFRINPDRDTLMSLTQENQLKVELIYMIALIIHNAGKEPMDMEEFDSLYDSEIKVLHTFAFSLENTLKLEKMFRELGFFGGDRSA
jgi:hypothetical protein